jgi:hypothetical protein
MKKEVLETANLPTSCTIFNNKLNSLQIYDIAQKQIILERVAQRVPT